MNACRIAVTGVGAVSSLGFDARSSYATMMAGRSGIATVHVDPGKYGPEPHDLLLGRLEPDTLELVERRSRGSAAEAMDSYAQLALASAVEALGDSDLPTSILAERTAVIFGHGTGGMTTLEDAYGRFFGQRSARQHPLTIPRTMLSSPASVIAMTLKVRGPVFATSSACSSSGHAIAQAALMLRAGVVDAAIVGGSESLATSSMLRCWESMRAMSVSGCRPFSADRDGMVVGEGAAALVLERLDDAVARSATIYAELLGEGCTSDAFNLTQPDLDGAIRAMTAATKGHLGASDRVMVSAHGTGTRLNDANESAAIRSVFDGLGSDYRVTATKSYHGHLLGASSALQIVLGLQAARDGKVPPILNFGERDPECDLPLVTREVVDFESTHLLSNAFAFGGLNVSLLFSVRGAQRRADGNGAASRM